MKEGEPPQNPEHEPDAYLKVARFTNEETSGRAYFETQRTIFTAEGNDLSVFRLQWEQTWHVAILGDPPQRALSRRIDRILSGGEPATLPDELIQLLKERRAEAVTQASWVEKHYRPTRER